MLPPLFHDLRKYSLDQFKGDLLAGVTVAVMLIPQGMAYAMIAGLPPVYGLYAAIFPQIMYGLFGSSRQLAVGPVAMDSVIVATGVSAIAVAHSGEYVSLVILLAFITGAIQLIMGWLKLGFIVNFLSRPVINGFTYAAALVISINQIGHLTGIDLSQNKYTHLVLSELALRIHETSWMTLSIGVTGIILIAGAKRWHKLIPSALIVVMASIIASKLLQFDKLAVKIIGDVPKGLPGFDLPSFHLADIINLFPIATTLAIIGFLEAFSIAKAIEPAHKNEYSINANRELLALGGSNIFGSLFGSFPVSGSFSRSAVNDNTGAKTGVASYVSALLVLATVLFFTPLFYHLPKAILASITIMAVMGLIDIKQCRYLWKTDQTDFYMMICTFLGTFLIGIKEGIAIGVALSLVMVIYKTTQPHLAVLGRIPKTTFFKNIDRFAEAEEIPGVLIIRFDSRIYFANVNFFKEKVEELVLEKSTGLKLLIIDAQSISSIDSSGMATLHEILDFCSLRKIDLAFVSVIGPVRDTFVKEGFANKLGEDHCFEQIDQAIDTFSSPKTPAGINRLKFQTNVKR